MKRINLTLGLLLAIGAVIGLTNQTAATSGPGMRECWHGTIDNPFRDFLGVVPTTAQCPEYQHPPVANTVLKTHIEGDPACQTSELNPLL